MQYARIRYYRYPGITVIIITITAELLYNSPHTCSYHSIMTFPIWQIYTQVQRHLGL